MTRKVNSKDWREIDIESWNGTTFRAYMNELHLSKFGIPYVATNIRVENGMISNACKEWGKPVVKRFVEICIENYKPSVRFPGINFGFMYSYMKNYVPRAMDEVRKETVQQKLEEASTNDIDSLRDLI